MPERLFSAICHDDDFWVGLKTEEVFKGMPTKEGLVDELRGCARVDETVGRDSGDVTSGADVSVRGGRCQGRRNPVSGGQDMFLSIGYRCLRVL